MSSATLSASNLTAGKNPAPVKKYSSSNAPDPESFGLPCTGVESHAHLDGPRFEADLPETLARAKRAGLAYIMQVFLSAKAWREHSPRFMPYPECYFLLGIHPTDIYGFADLEAELADIRSIIEKDKAGERRIKALGEIGLDYYWKEVPPEAQIPVFRRQLALARDLGLPVVIHCRDAVEDTLGILEEENFSGRPLLWHCFGGDTALARRVLANGWHLSIPGPITFPANQALREAVAVIPAERLLLETDCPYLAPLPHRGRRNEPAYLAFTVQALAASKNMEAAELWTSCGRAAREFFGLPPLASE